MDSCDDVLERKIQVAIKWFSLGWSQGVARKKSGLTQGEWYSDHPKIVELRKYVNEGVVKKRKSFYPIA